MKIIITESQLNKLNEDITAGRMIVYHRTGKKGFNPSKNIANVGYIVSDGAHYGYGVYTTYDLESQMGDNMKNNYGNIIIESQIIDTSKFLIFNYDIAKKIYKSRYRFIDQLKQILGKKEWLKYKDNSIIKNIDYRLEQENIVYTSNIALDFYGSFKDSILQKLNGMIFTGGNDGNVLVSYNRRNIEPLRYSEDNGKTWTNIRNVKTYQRIKEPYDLKKDPEFQHLLNKLEVDPRFDIKNIPSKYHEYLFNFLSKKDNSKLNHNESKIIKNIELIKKFGSYDIFEILNNSTDKKETAIELIEIGGDRLTSIEINTILLYFTIPDNKSLINIDVLIIKIIESKGENLQYQLVESLLEYSTDKDLIVAKIIETKGRELNSNDIRFILKYSTDKDIIATKIIDLKGEELKPVEINNLIMLSNNKDLIAIKIIDAKGDKLEISENISHLLYDSKNKDLIVTKIIDAKGKQLTNIEIWLLLDYTKKNVINTKKLISFGYLISEQRYMQLTPLLQKYYKKIRGVRGVAGYIDWEFKYLTDNERIKYIDLKGKELLHSEDVMYLVRYSTDKDLIASKIIDVKGEELTSDNIKVLLLYSVSINKSYNIIIKIIKTLGVKLYDDNLIGNLIAPMLDTEYKDLIIREIIDVIGNKLNNVYILFLVVLSNDKELTKKTLLQKGVDYKLINDIITTNEIDTPLIPDNYQEMLNEIKRIKEIIR
jgi:hypothetical protein